MCSTLSRAAEHDLLKCFTVVVFIATHRSELLELVCIDCAGIVYDTSLYSGALSMACDHGTHCISILLLDEDTKNTV